MPKKFSAYEGTARSHLAMGKIRGGESLTEVPKILHYGFRAGLFPVQYYNRFGAKKSHRCGLERTGADIGTEAFYPVVYCGRIDYSGNCANRKISIGSDGYPNL